MADVARVIASANAFPGDTINAMELHTSGSGRSQSYERCRFFLITIVIVALSPRRTAAAYGRTLILENLMKNRDNSSRLIPCITAFVDEYFDRPDKMWLLLPDQPRDTPDLVPSLLNELYTRSAVYTSNVGLMDTMKIRNVSGNAIILSKNATALDERRICFADYFSNNRNFVIALTSPFADEASFLTAVDALIQRVCLRSIFDLAILAPVGDSVLLAGSFLERIDKIYTPTKSAVLGKCEEKATAVRWQRFANKTRTSSDKRIMNAAMFERYPYSFFTNNTGQLMFDGVVGTMVEEIARNKKIELNREVIAKTNNSVDEELYLRLHNSTKDDLVFGGLLWNPNHKIEYTNSYGMVRIGWIIPMETNISLRGLISPFKGSVWYAIIAVLIIGGLVKMLLIRDISFLDIVALVIGAPTARQPSRTSGRIQFMAWVLFGFFLTLFYLASLAHQLIHTADLQIESLEELISSGLQLGGTDDFLDLLGNDTDDIDDILQTIRENFIIFEQADYISQMTDLVAGKNDSLALLVMLNLSHVHEAFDIGHGHIIKETMGSYPLALASWRGFSYLNDINFAIQVVLQTGLINFWTDMVVLKTNYYEVEDEDDNTKINLKDITPAFLLLVMGYLSGCCLLVIEIFFYPSRFLQ